MRIFLILFLLPIWVLANWNVDLSQLPVQLKDSVLESLRDQKFENLTQGEVDDLIKIIHLNAQYDPVVATVKDSKTVIITVESRSRIQSLKFLGSDKFSSSEIRRIMTVQEGDTFEPDRLVRQAEELQDYLRSLGYIEAEVEVEFPEAQPFQIDLKVIIKPGRPTQIQEIEFFGKNTELMSRLKRQTKKLLGDILTDSSLKELQDRIDEVLKTERAFMARRLPPEVLLNSQKNKARIQFTIEDDHQYTFQITGSTQLSSLISLDETLDLSQVTLGNTNLVSDLTNRLRQYYFKKGYARVEIMPEQKNLTSFKKIVNFQIKEGPVVKIEKITVQGRISKSSESYQKLFLTVAEPLIRKRFYQKEDLDRSLENFKLLLQNQGYLQANITSSRAIYNNERDRLDITINLDEGVLTRVEGFLFENTKAFSNEILQKVVGFTPGEPLQLNKIEDSLVKLKNHYKNNGYLEMLILNERIGLVRYNEDNSKAQLVYKIFEGPKVQVQSIYIEGLKQTKDYVVLNELDFAVGDILTPSKIEESISRIQRTGHFSSVDIRTVEDKTEVEKRTVLVRVTEANPGKLSIGLGLTNERDITVRGYLGLAYRNIYGTGRGISARVDGNYNISDIQFLENRVTVGYLEPFLFNSRYKGRLNLTRSESITDFERERATETLQQTWSIEKDFTSHLTGVWDVYTRASSEDFNIRGEPDRLRSIIGSTGITLDADFRDNLVRPRKGHQSRMSFEYGNPDLGSTKTIEFFRASASATAYASFWDNKVTWSNGIRYGFLENLSPRSDGAVPYNRKGFYLGGPSTIRGFDPTSEAFPSSELLESVDDRMTKQTRMYLVRSTISYPIISIVEGTLFYDGGQIEVDGLDLGFGYRHAAGFGILINTPVGPLNLEFGFKLNQKSGESPSAFHLSFGLF